MKAHLAMAVAAMLAASQARAAEITERASPNSVAGGYAFDRVITISGELEKGDADKFRTAISGFDHLLVELNGPGGLLEEGLIIGREIRARHFATGVAPDWRCLSACATAWLAGTPRIADRSAVIMFHHAWNDEGTPDLDDATNAVLGAYLGSLGLSSNAIFFMTVKGKDDGNFLTEETAQVYGIETVFLGKAAPMARADTKARCCLFAASTGGRPMHRGKAAWRLRRKTAPPPTSPRFIVARGCRATGTNLARKLIASTASKSIAV
jgi:hypothetical protein